MAVSSLAATSRSGYLSPIGGIPTARTPAGTKIIPSPSRIPSDALGRLKSTLSPSPVPAGLGAVPNIQDLLKKTLGQGVAPIAYDPTVGTFKAPNPYGADVSITTIPEIAAAEAAKNASIASAANKARQDIIFRLIAAGDPTFAAGLGVQRLTELAQARGFSPESINSAADLLNVSPETMNMIRGAYGTQSEINAMEATGQLTPEQEQQRAILRDIGPSGVGQRAQLERAATQTGRSIGGALASRNMFRSGEFPYLQREASITRNIGEQSYLNNLISGLASAVADRAAANAAAEQTFQNVLNTVNRAVATNPSQYPEVAPNIGPTVDLPAPVYAPAPVNLRSIISPSKYRVLQSLLSGGTR